jgi:transcriptional regulator with XRE-family HTH domain
MEEQAFGYGALLQGRREDLGISRMRAARIVGVDESMLRQVERGTRTPGTALRRRLDALIAYGDGAASEEVGIVYLLAEVPEPGTPTPLIDQRKRIGLFADRDLADSACRWLAALGCPHAVPVPVWPLTAGVLWGTAPPYGNGARVIDSGDDAREIAARITAWLASALTQRLVEPLRGIPPHIERQLRGTQPVREAARAAARN